MKGSTNGDIMAFDSELLSTSPGLMQGRAVVLLTFRPDPEHTFASHNYAISRAQAIRLRDDLNYLFETSDLLKEPEEVAAEPQRGSEPRTPIRPKRRGRKK